MATTSGAAVVPDVSERTAETDAKSSSIIVFSSRAEFEPMLGPENEATVYYRLLFITFNQKFYA